ncbi:MAG TPA: hypothetical protein VN782_15850 [Usitatibacter sp.]|nr:hypothetical protein [Usitatibacter sp.]
MAKPRTARIFIKRGEEIRQFMWANQMADGSVYLGFPWEAKQKVELVLDETGPIPAAKLVVRELLERPKISFHSSGNYKLQSFVGKTEDAIDRVTVTGPKLVDIKGPERMVEIILPKELPQVGTTPSDNDITLEAHPEERPLRCTISCIRNDIAAEMMNSDKPFVSTSAWEATGYLQNPSHTWAWTLRSSREDEVYSNNVKVLLLGPVKWGGPSPK